MAQVGKIEDRQNARQIQSKRQQFYIQIKQRIRNSIISHIRCKYLSEQKNQSLQKLIQKTQSQISQQEVVTLVNYATQNLSNAVIHIGNLLIDQILTTRVLELLGYSWLHLLNMNSGHFQWLLLILLDKRYYNQQFLIYQKMILNIISSKVGNQFRVLNCLKCLTYLIKYHKQVVNIMILRNSKQNNILSLLEYCFSQNMQLYKQSWKLANSIFNQQNYQTSFELISIYSVDQFLKLIQYGLMSMQSHTRAQACQILNNNIQIFLYLNQNQLYEHKVKQLLQICFNLVSHDKQKLRVKIEISYLLCNYLGRCSIIHVLQAITKGIAKVINNLRELSKDQKNSQLSQNCQNICQLMTKFCLRQPASQEQKYILHRIYSQISSQGILTVIDGSNSQNMQDIY